MFVLDIDPVLVEDVLPYWTRIVDAIASRVRRGCHGRPSFSAGRSLSGSKAEERRCRINYPAPTKISLKESSELLLLQNQENYQDGNGEVKVPIGRTRRRRRRG